MLDGTLTAYPAPGTTVDAWPDPQTPGVPDSSRRDGRVGSRPHPGRLVASREDRLEVCVLDNVSITPRSGPTVPIGSLQQKLLLTLLVGYGARAVSVDVIAEELWGEHPPRRWLASIRTLANSLRRAADDRDFVFWTGRGYRLHRDPDRVHTDVAEMVARADEAEAALHAGDFDLAERAARRALAVYGGGPWTTDCWHWGDVAASMYCVLGRALIERESHLACIVELSQAPEELGWHEGIHACLEHARVAASGPMELS